MKLKQVTRICRICQAEDQVKFYGSTRCADLPSIYKEKRPRQLFKCQKCGSIAVAPLPSVEELAAYYNSYNGSYQDSQDWRRRRVFPLIVQVAHNLEGGKVLDIGCSHGTLLAHLPDSLEKHGVEIAQEAMSVARDKGINVCSGSWEAYEFHTHFDLIIALDFLEHALDPVSAVSKMARLLAPGGYLIIETGNADSWAAKILGEDWGYTSVFGHLTVLTPQALVLLAHEMRINIVSLTKGRHIFHPVSKAFYRAFQAYGFRIFRLAFPFFESTLGNLGMLRDLYEHPLIGAALFDHMIFIGKKADDCHHGPLN
jgi:SAM-dependent methyltransferase